MAKYMYVLLENLQKRSDLGTIFPKWSNRSTRALASARWRTPELAHFLKIAMHVGESDILLNYLCGECHIGEPIGAIA